MSVGSKYSFKTFNSLKDKYLLFTHLHLDVQKISTYREVRNSSHNPQYNQIRTNGNDCVKVRHKESNYYFFQVWSFDEVY
jgi:hypothetical protein